MQRQEWLMTDLQKPVRLTELRTDLFMNDDTGNLIGVTVKNGGTDVTLTGDVRCYMIRPDGTTLTIDGTASGNQATVILPENAYYYTGRANFVIKAEADGNRVTLAAFTGIVYRDQSDALVDNDRVIPSLSEIMEVVNQINNMTLSVTTLPAGLDATGLLETVNGHYAISLGIPRGVSGSEPDVRTVTLPAANWSGSDPATQTVTVTGVSVGSVLIVGLAESATDEQYIQASLARLICTGSAANALTVSAEGITPTVDIPITVINLSESGDSRAWEPPERMQSKRIYLQNGTITSSGRTLTIKDGVITAISGSSSSVKGLRGFWISNTLSAQNANAADAVPPLNSLMPVSLLHNLNTLITHVETDAEYDNTQMRVYFCTVDESDNVTVLSTGNVNQMKDGLNVSALGTPNNATHYAVRFYFSTAQKDKYWIVHPEFCYR